jgi:ferredoxin
VSVLLSVNVGLPRDVDWQGKTVYTGIWKYPVDGPAMVRRLNIDGDGQGDTNGHGGEQRAVFVYQIQSYRYWQRHFGRDDFSYGQFGENLTVDGLPDDEVCISDRYRIGEADALLASLPHAHEHVFYSAAAPSQPQSATATAGRLTKDKLVALAVPADATAYVCGPASFMSDIGDALTAAGLEPAQIHTELFGALPSINPGLTGQTRRPPHQPPGPPGTGPLVTFSRSGISAPFPAGERNVLELAEACDVPARWSCRTGVCHTCVTPMLSGDIGYSPDPLEPPAGGDVLICCARPRTDIVLDM